MTYENIIKANVAVIISIFILIGALGVLLGLVWPALIDLNEAKLEKERKKEEKLAKENLVERIQILVGQFESLDPRLREKVERTVPKGQNTPDILVQLENMASESNLIIDRVDFLPVEQTSKKETSAGKSTLVSVALKGDYPAFSKWLNLFESNSRLFDIRSVDFNLFSLEKRNIFTFKIKFLFYHQ